MAAAKSPRQPAPRLKSTAVEQYGSPRREHSKYEAVALARGYTVRAGKNTRDRLNSKRTKGDG